MSTTTSTILTPSQISLLPKDKHDSAAITHISTLPIPQIEPLLPSLLTWLQDPNWPIARDVLLFILHYPESVVEPVREILQTDNVTWVYVVLVNVVKELPLEERKKLREEIERIAWRPSKEEKEDEVDVKARGFLKGLGEGE